MQTHRLADGWNIKPICESDNPVLGALCYNGYEKTTGLKFLATDDGNGHTVHVAPTAYGGSHNDQYLVNHCGLCQHLETSQRLYWLAPGIPQELIVYFGSYGDFG